MRKTDAPQAVHKVVEKKAEIRVDEAASRLRNKSMLKCLTERVEGDDDIKDESDIVWTDVDRACDLSMGESGRRHSCFMFYKPFLLLFYCRNNIVL